MRERPLARAQSGLNRVLPSAACSITKKSSCSRRRSSTSRTRWPSPGILDNVEDLLTDVITSPRFDSEVFTLERSLQVMLGPRAGTTLVGLLTVAPEVFDEVAEVRDPVRGPRAARRLARPVRAGDRQRPELPQQPRRDPGPQLRDAGRPRRGAPRPPGPPDARPLQQRAAVLRRRRERLPRPRLRHHGAARAVSRARRDRRRDGRAPADAIALIERKTTARG